MQPVIVAAAVRISEREVDPRHMREAAEVHLIVELRLRTAVTKLPAPFHFCAVIGDPHSGELRKQKGRLNATLANDPSGRPAQALLGLFQMVADPACHHLFQRHAITSRHPK